MLLHLIIQFSFNCLSTGRLQEVRNKRKFEIVSSKSGRGRLREVVAYKRFQIQRFHLKHFGILRNWSAVTGGSTVVIRK